MMIAPWILGHFAIIICIFTTWLVFKHAGARADNALALKENNESDKAVSKEDMKVKGYITSWIQQEDQLGQFSVDRKNS